MLIKKKKKKIPLEYQIQKILITRRLLFVDLHNCKETSFMNHHFGIIVNI